MSIISSTTIWSWSVSTKKFSVDIDVLLSRLNGHWQHSSPHSPLDLQKSLIDDVSTGVDYPLSSSIVSSCRLWKKGFWSLLILTRTFFVLSSNILRNFHVLYRSHSDVSDVPVRRWRNLADCRISNSPTYPIIRNPSTALQNWTNHECPIDRSIHSISRTCKETRVHELLDNFHLLGVTLSPYESSPLRLYSVLTHFVLLDPRVNQSGKIHPLSKKSWSSHRVICRMMRRRAVWTIWTNHYPFLSCLIQWNQYRDRSLVLELHLIEIVLREYVSKYRKYFSEQLLLDKRLSPSRDPSNETRSLFMKIYPHDVIIQSDSSIDVLSVSSPFLRERSVTDPDYLKRFSLITLVIRLSLIFRSRVTSDTTTCHVTRP